MKTISANVVEETWREMGGSGIADAKKLAARMTKEQPFIQAYLLALGERDFNPDEARLLFYLGMVVWLVFDRAGRPKVKVSGAMLDKAEKDNAKMLEYLEGESGAEFAETVERLLDGCNQVEVLRYVVNALMEEPEEGCEIRDEYVGEMFVDLKTVIDCLDRGVLTS